LKKFAQEYPRVPVKNMAMNATRMKSRTRQCYVNEPAHQAVLTFLFWDVFLITNRI